MSSLEYGVAPAEAPYNTPPALIAFTLGVLVVCFVAFSLVFLCKYCFSSVIHTIAFQRTASGSLIRLTPHRSPPPGLDPSLLHLFPTFLYSSVKDLRKEKYSLECAICLLEFEDDNMLRLLTLCCHVFHQDCIDLWLSSHKTCPVCRRDLDSPEQEETTHKSAEVTAEEAVSTDTLVLPTIDQVRIDVRQGEEGSADGNKKEKEKEKESDGCESSEHEDAEIREQGEKIFVRSRSHSTGHSIVMIRGEGDDDEGKNDDKYTLRLPEHVLRVRQSKHNFTRSCSNYKDMTGLVAPPCSNCGFVQPLSAGCSSSSQSHKS